VDTPADAHDALTALATGTWSQVVLATVRRLDLIALLGARAADLEEVCYSLGTQRYPTLLLLTACEGLGLVQHRDDAYVLGPLTRPIYEAHGATLADWAEATAERRRCDALVAALRGDPPPAEPGLASPALGLSGLHATAAAALAAHLAVPAGGLAVELGGQGIFAAPLLARAPELRVAIPGSEPGALDAVERLGQPERVRLVESTDLERERAQLAIVAQLHPAEGRAALWGHLQRARTYLSDGAALAVVGPFLTQDAGRRPTAPLLALAALAADRAAWCPTLDAVAERVQAAGFARVEIVLLPEPDAAAIGYPSG